MFSRRVTAKLKMDVAKQVPNVIQNDVLPLLRKQKGFRDEVVMVAPERSELLALSFWDTQQDAEAYGRTTYPEVLKALVKVVDGTPTVQAYDVADCTFHKTIAHKA